jgi:ABC-type multidrug transport system permease subunit
VAMNFIESVLLLVFAWFVFGITIQGSIPALLMIFLAGNIVFAGIAVLISSHTSNTEIGNGLINAVVMPMMVLSGVFFSYHNFPEWSIPVIQKLPLTLLADGMRSIFIEGAGIKETFMPFLIMVSAGMASFAAGLKVFKWH